MKYQNKDKKVNSYKGMNLHENESAWRMGSVQIILTRTL